MVEHGFRKAGVEGSSPSIGFVCINLQGFRSLKEKRSIVKSLIKREIFSQND